MKKKILGPQIAVFLDRDGTINEDRGYVTSVEEFVLFPEVGESIARLNHLGFPVLVVTNQSAIGRGLMTEQDLTGIHEHLSCCLKRVGAHVDAFYFCPHQPADRCGCRKPQPGMIHRAVLEFSLDAAGCYLIGDKPSDLEAAQASGIRGVLVKTSPYAQQALDAFEAGQLSIAHVAENFPHAVDWIIQELFPGHGTNP